MKFSIVTPSFNQLDYLKRCVASVADQSGVEVEHIVMDGGSTDGTVQWLSEYASKQLATSSYKLTFTSEADEGMYDALNKGFNRASGDVLAWLNCDEQYLPGALQNVWGFLSKHRDVDLISGDALVIDVCGKLIGFWKSMPLRRKYLENSYLYNLSCAMFFRKSIFSQDVFFNTEFRAVGDQDLLIRLLEQGLKSGVMRSYLAAYTFSRDNLSEQEFAVSEQEAVRTKEGNRAHWTRPVWAVMQRAERVLRGCRFQKFLLDYSLYVDGEVSRRQFTSGRVSPKWPGCRRNT